MIQPSFKAESPGVSKVTQRSLEALFAELRTTGTTPLLRFVKAREPVVGQYILATGCGLWNELEAIPMHSGQRERLQMTVLDALIVIAGILLRASPAAAELGTGQTDRELAIEGEPC